MPYKDPERKRQWEQEHREQRNARRRKTIVSSALHPWDHDAQRRNPTAIQAPASGMVVPVGVRLGELLYCWMFVRV
jgi:hypothetical protein